MNVVWVVVGEYLYEFSEVVSVWRSEDAANAAAKDVEARKDDRYDYVRVERHEVG